MSAQIVRIGRGSSFVKSMASRLCYAKLSQRKRDVKAFMSSPHPDRSARLNRRTSLESSAILSCSKPIHFLAALARLGRPFSHALSRTAFLDPRRR